MVDEGIKSSREVGRPEWICSMWILLLCDPTTLSALRELRSEMASIINPGLEGTTTTESFSAVLVPLSSHCLINSVFWAGGYLDIMSEDPCSYLFPYI